MTETITDPDEIREVAEELRAEYDRELSPEQMQQEFKVHDLHVRLTDLLDAVEFN